MHLLLAVAVYLIIGAALGLGIFLAVKGSFWWLIVVFLAYVLAFARLGCRTPHS